MKGNIASLCHDMGKLLAAMVQDFVTLKETSENTVLPWLPLIMATESPVNLLLCGVAMAVHCVGDSMQRETCFPSTVREFGEKLDVATKS